MLICPSCKENKLVNSQPISKYIACYSCRKMFELIEYYPIDSFDRIGKTVKINSINGKTINKGE